MFAYLQGTLTHKSPSVLHLDVNGIGYEVNITLQTFTAIQALDACKLFIHVRIMEDAWTLFGFAEEAERITFRMLLGISGVGAMTARLVLSALTPAELERAVSGGDAKLLERIKGIGPKAAQRIVLELKGKLKPGEGDTITSTKGFAHNTVEDDALVALVNLGIARAQAETAMKKLTNKETMTVEELIKGALKVL